jgi:hypothetical protein
MTAGNLERLPIMDRTVRIARLVFLAFLALYGVASLRAPEAGRLLDSVDLAIHETGHLVFAPLGEVPGFLGGTLFQLLLPAAFTAYFLRRGDRYGGAVCLWWVAQNCWNVSVYVADARLEELPLVGGGEHDWAYLLGAAGWLEHDIAIARAVHRLGIALFVIAIWLGFRAANWMQPAEIGRRAAPLNERTPARDSLR